MTDPSYIHGTDPSEQTRLKAFNKLVNKSFLDFLELDGVESILEIGSGLGVLTSEVAKRAMKAQVTGIEISEAQLTEATRHSTLNLHFVKGDATCLPFDDATFDLVYCRWVLEHVPSPMRILREVLRVLRPGGRFFIDEVDVSSQRYDPPTPNFDLAWKAVTQLQSELGGDNLIGRRLPRLLTESGFPEVVASSEAIVLQSGSEEFSCWVENERAIILGCSAEMKNRGLLKETILRAALEELDQIQVRNDSTSWYCWYRAIGCKHHM